METLTLVTYILLASPVFANLITYKVPLSNTFKELLGYPEEAFQNFTQIATQNGYLAEEHTVITEDGYILKLFRMSSGSCSALKGTPVLLMHGVIMSSDVFLDAGPDAGLAYLLAGSCFDLWVGNVRGNYYGRNHTTLNPDEDEEFWHFSSDEMGYYDVPAQIDYVRNVTGWNKINYVGFSQGGEIYLTNCLDRPEYCERVKVFVGISPATRLTNLKSLTTRLFFSGGFVLDKVQRGAGLQEVLFRGSALESIFELICQSQNFLNIPYAVCNSFIYLFDAYHPGSILESTIKILYSHFPAGASVRLLSKYGQGLKTSKFLKYDYGNKTKNLEAYGSETPPEYDVTKFNVPTVLIHGSNDQLVVNEDQGGCT